jgi:hypothetical protein
MLVWTAVLDLPRSNTEQPLEYDASTSNMEGRAQPTRTLYQMRGSHAPWRDNVIIVHANTPPAGGTPDLYGVSATD